MNRLESTERFLIPKLERELGVNHREVHKARREVEGVRAELERLREGDAEAWRRFREQRRSLPPEKRVGFWKDILVPDDPA
jgi:hypothetical protein